MGTRVWCQYETRCAKRKGRLTGALDCGLFRRKTMRILFKRKVLLLRNPHLVEHFLAGVLIGRGQGIHE